MFFFRIRDENLAKRGIDGNDTEQLIKAEEERGKVLLQQYMEQKKDSKNFIPRQEADDILEPLKGAFQLMETAINMRGNYTHFWGENKKKSFEFDFS